MITTNDAPAEPPNDPFLCNICGNVVDAYPFVHIEREGGQCSFCGSHCRVRTLAHLVSIALFGVSAPVTLWQKTDATIYGISDWIGFQRFAAATNYVNTQFDRELYPDAVFLDITKPDRSVRKKADILICSEVLEHVPPPVQLGFDGLFELLKPGGTLVLSVPYTFAATQEHFPNLHSWSLDSEDGKRRLINTSAAGVREEFDDLVFHGGGDAVLEMRVFGLPAVLDHLQRAGFVDANVAYGDFPEYGIRNGSDYSRAITARRPKATPWYARGKSS